MSLISQDDKFIWEWHIPLSSPEYSAFDEAFHEAKIKFAAIIQEPAKLHLTNSAHNLEDLQDAVTSCLNKYESQQKYPKIRKWLQSFSQRVHFYGAVVDVLVQHHPEYVSLVWGAMKFLFVAVINHEKTITKLAKALSQLADAMPQIKLVSVLYPTKRMKDAIVDLNVNILRFLTRAHKWYQEGTLKHILHSITQPVELRYDDIIESMTECSATIQLVAEGSHQLELRQMHGKIDHINTTIDENARMNMKLSEVEKRLEAISTHMSLQSSAMVDTNRYLSSLQFSQIMESISTLSICEPSKSLQQLQIASRRHILNHRPPLSNSFLNSPKLKKWDSSEVSNISIVKSAFTSRQALRGFCVDMILQLQRSQIPVLFAMKTPHVESTASITSPGDVIKYLVKQGLEAQESLQTERSMSLNHVRFREHLTETQWFQLLESVISGFDGNVYILIDLELLNETLCNDQDHGQRFNWLSAFMGFFNTLSQRQSSARVKVLLVSYTIEMPFALTDDQHREFLISAKTKPKNSHLKKSKLKTKRMRTS